LGLEDSRSITVMSVPFWAGTKASVAMVKTPSDLLR
jgi:hypothetical protein